MGILKAILVTVLYMILLELTGLWVYIPEALKIDNSLTYYVLIQGICQLILVLTLLFIFKKERLGNLLIRTRSIWYLLAVAMAVSFLFVTYSLNWLSNFLLNTSYSSNYDLDGIKLLLNINYTSIILILPIAEELLFRRYIQDSLQQRMNSVLAILLASMLFALIHSPILELLLGDSSGSWYQFYVTIFIGLFSGFLYYKSKSIGPSIIFHIAWNLIATIL